MSKVTRAVYYLNQANDEREDNEKPTINTGTAASTANQDANSTSANEGVMPRRSKRLDKSTHDLAMNFEVNSVAAARSKKIESGTTGGGARKRKSDNASILERSKK